MDLRVHSLTHLDPETCPLPHGTEVMTRVARVAGDRTLPQSTLGRVARVQGDQVDVTILGVGTVRFSRRELRPRKIGQLRFALRRAAAWDALSPCIVLETLVGSRAWGVAEAGADEDRRGVFVAPLPWGQGLVPAPEDLLTADSSAIYWALGKAVRQALRADPNTLETLFLPGATARDELGAWLLAERDAFVSAEIYGSFGRYALSQLRRFEQGLRLAEHRHTLLEWLRADPSLTLEQTARKLAQVSPRVAPTEADAVVQAQLFVKQLYRSLFDQGQLAGSDFRSLQRFAEATRGQIELPREYRPKNAYNLVRLLITAIGWLRQGVPTFAATGAVRDRLLAIKRGQVPIADVMAQAEELGRELEAARQGSPLPRRADVVRADRLLLRCHAEVARRFVQRVPGPFGADAPASPEAAWDEEA